MNEARSAARRRTRLQSAKILDSAGAFLCEALILDMSELGVRLLLARNCGVPAQFVLHIDLTGELSTAALAWRRARVIGARKLPHVTPTPLKPSDRAALKGRYYGVPG